MINKIIVQAFIYDITQNVYFKRFIAFLVLGRIFGTFHLIKESLQQI